MLQVGREGGVARWVGEWCYKEGCDTRRVVIQSGWCYKVGGGVMVEV